MKLTAEASIDVDENRKIWIMGNAEDVQPDEVADTARALIDSVTANAIAANGQVGNPLASAPSVDPAAAAIVSKAAKQDAQPLAPSQRPKRPDDPATMQTFGDED